MHDTAFSDAIEAIYAAAATPRHWPTALQAIADCFGDVGTIMVYQNTDGTTASIVSPSLAEAGRVYRLEGWGQHDLRFQRAYQRGYFSTIDAISDRHVATEQEIESHPYYTDFLRRQGLKWFAGVNISPDPGIAVALSVQRLSSKPAFGDEELETLVRLGRHVENALRLTVRLMNAEAAQTTLADILARLQVGTFLLDGGGRILFHNAMGERLLADGLCVTQSRLSAPRPPHAALLREAIQSACKRARDPAPPRPVVLPRQAGDGFLAVYLVPVIADADIASGLMRSASVFAVVTSTDPDQPIEPTLARDLLGLTLAEAKVASLVAAGLAPREAGERLGIAEDTVRTQLRSIFQKSGVSRQGDLAALLNRLALRGAAIRETGNDGF